MTKFYRKYARIIAHIFRVTRITNKKKLEKLDEVSSICVTSGFGVLSLTWAEKNPTFNGHSNPNF